ncbi:tetratricopeptide repeat protein [Limnothrix redekei]|uniref:Tetratricopeptide repeat protein n=1 Tax=Limnothrix redekei LRLZ20PSL1 TaxID=3112953 RepID=A0ABW7CDQ2_9CYAN
MSKLGKLSFKKQSIRALQVLAVLWGCMGLSMPARAEVLLPYAPPIDPQWSEQALDLAQDAARLVQFEQYDEALARIRVAAYLAPKNPQVLRLMGGLYLQSQQIDRGIQVLESARALAPEDPSVLLALGSAYGQQKRWDEALTTLQAGLKLQDSPTGRFDLGNVYLTMGRFQQAIEQFRQAVTLEARMWPAVNNIGLALYELGDRDNALKEWEAALAVDPTAAEPKLAIATATYTAAGCQSQARDPNCLKGLALAQEALDTDERYADLQYLKDNLWGTQLLKDAQVLLDRLKRDRAAAR